jgi:hypothetical protein
MIRSIKITLACNGSNDSSLTNSSTASMFALISGWTLVRFSIIAKCRRALNRDNACETPAMFMRSVDRGDHCCSSDGNYFGSTSSTELIARTFTDQAAVALIRSCRTTLLLNLLGSQARERNASTIQTGSRSKGPLDMQTITSPARASFAICSASAAVDSPSMAIGPRSRIARIS